MKESMRAKRMIKHHKRMSAIPKLNLVSLMDIFTILVFFLLFNSSDVEVLSSDKSIQLPESVAEKKPDTTLLIKVNNDKLVVGSLEVASVPQILASEGGIIPELEEELQLRKDKRLIITEQEKEKGFAVTIMGDQAVPYKLLKRVMQTSAESGYRDISLSVVQIAGSSQEGAN